MLLCPRLPPLPHLDVYACSCSRSLVRREIMDSRFYTINFKGQIGLVSNIVSIIFELTLFKSPNINIISIHLRVELGSPSVTTHIRPFQSSSLRLSAVVSSKFFPLYHFFVSHHQHFIPYFLSPAAVPLYRTTTIKNIISYTYFFIYYQFFIY
jgi:hypothetical protein